MKIKTESEFRQCQAELEVIIQAGTLLDDMELLDEQSKSNYIRLSEMISEWEAAYHPLPGRISTLITDAIKEKMCTEKQEM